MILIRPTSTFRGVQRISAEGFAKLLSEANSPAAQEDMAAQYQACVDADIDALFILAMFRHESNFGTAGAAVKTKSWGNTRLPAIGPTPIGLLNQDTGTMYDWLVPRPAGRYLCAYDTWLDGLRSTLARLNSTEWPDGNPYMARTAIQEVFIHQSGAVWAPAGDMNNPDGYLRAVVDYMAAHAETDGINMTMGLEKLADRQAIVDIAGQANSPDRLMWGGRPKFVTIHETDNPNVGANAEMHRKFVDNGGGDDDASFHAAIDSKESVQILPWNVAAYHIGDGDNGEGNNTSIGLEMCVNADGDYNQTVLRTIALARKLLTTFQLPISALRYHGQWWSAAHPDVHRGCPALLLGGKRGWTWAGFVAAVNKSQAVMDEEAKRKLLFDTIAAEFPGTEAARLLGDLEREGALLDSQNRPVERAAKFKKSILHTWEGNIVAMFREGPTSEQALLDAKKLVWY